MKRTVIVSQDKGSYLSLNLTVLRTKAAVSYILYQVTQLLLFVTRK